MRTLTREQYRALEGLAYRIADNAYMIERYGYEDTKHERADNHKVITSLFDELDALGTPWALQNNIICKYENWRLYKEDYFREVLRKLGYEEIGRETHYDN